MAMRLRNCILLLSLLTALMLGLAACQKADPATKTLGGVVDRQG